MDTLSTLLTVCSAVLGCSTLVGWLLYRKAMRRIKDAEATKAEADAAAAQWQRYEKQLDHAMATIDRLYQQIERDAGTISDKTDRIRGITDELIETQRKLNQANEDKVRLTEERDKERALKELYRQWMCHKHCDDREPPNAKLAGKDFRQQKRELLSQIRN